MIRYLLILYLGAVSILLVDANPLWSTPLLLVAASFLWDSRWPGIVGLTLFSLITLDRVGTGGLTDLWGLLELTALILVPEVLLLELVISPKPYRIEKMSLLPMIISLLLVLVFSSVLLIMTRFQRIGVYISSDPTLQVFVLMALSIFFTGPILLGSLSSKGEQPTRKGP